MASFIIFLDSKNKSENVINNQGNPTPYDFTEEKTTNVENDPFADLSYERIVFLIS